MQLKTLVLHLVLTGHWDSLGYTTMGVFSTPPHTVLVRDSEEPGTIRSGGERVREQAAQENKKDQSDY